MNTCRIRVSFLVLCVLPLFGQTAGSEFYGIVTDATGAVIPAAIVRLTSETRGYSSTSQTNEQGYYLFPNLLAGGYRLEVSSKG